MWQGKALVSWLFDHVLPFLEALNLSRHVIKLLIRILSAPTDLLESYTVYVACAHYDLLFLPPILLELCFRASTHVLLALVRGRFLPWGWTNSLPLSFPLALGTKALGLPHLVESSLNDWIWVSLLTLLTLTAAEGNARASAGADCGAASTSAGATDAPADIIGYATVELLMERLKDFTQSLLRHLLRHDDVRAVTGTGIVKGEQPKGAIREPPPPGPIPTDNLVQTHTTSNVVEPSVQDIKTAKDDKFREMTTLITDVMESHFRNNEWDFATLNETLIEIKGDLRDIKSHHQDSTRDKQQSFLHKPSPEPLNLSPQELESSVLEPKALILSLIKKNLLDTKCLSQDHKDGMEYIRALDSKVRDIKDRMVEGNNDTTSKLVQLRDALTSFEDEHSSKCSCLNEDIGAIKSVLEIKLGQIAASVIKQSKKLDALTQNLENWNASAGVGAELLQTNEGKKPCCGGGLDHLNERVTDLAVKVDAWKGSMVTDRGTSEEESLKVRQDMKALMSNLKSVWRLILRKVDHDTEAGSDRPSTSENSESGGPEAESSLRPKDSKENLPRYVWDICERRTLAQLNRALTEFISRLTEAQSLSQLSLLAGAETPDELRTNLALGKVAVPLKLPLNDQARPFDLGCQVNSALKIDVGQRDKLTLMATQIGSNSRSELDSRIRTDVDFSGGSVPKLQDMARGQSLDSLTNIPKSRITAVNRSTSVDNNLIFMRNFGVGTSYKDYNDVASATKPIISTPSGQSLTRLKVKKNISFDKNYVPKGEDETDKNASDIPRKDKTYAQVRGVVDQIVADVNLSMAIGSQSKNREGGGFETYEEYIGEQRRSNGPIARPDDIDAYVESVIRQKMNKQTKIVVTNDDTIVRPAPEPKTSVAGPRNLTKCHMPCDVPIRVPNLSFIPTIAHDTAQMLVDSTDGGASIVHSGGERSLRIGWVEKKFAAVGPPDASPSSSATNPTNFTINITTLHQQIDGGSHLDSVPAVVQTSNPVTAATQTNKHITFEDNLESAQPAVVTPAYNPSGTETLDELGKVESFTKSHHLKRSHDDLTSEAEANLDNSRYTFSKVPKNSVSLPRSLQLNLSRVKSEPIIEECHEGSDSSPEPPSVKDKTLLPLSQVSFDTAKDIVIKKEDITPVELTLIPEFPPKVEPELIKLENIKYDEESLSLDTIVSEKANFAVSCLFDVCDIIKKVKKLPSKPSRSSRKKAGSTSKTKSKSSKTMRCGSVKRASSRKRVKPKSGKPRKKSYHKGTIREKKSRGKKREKIKMSRKESSRKKEKHKKNKESSTRKKRVRRRMKPRMKAKDPSKATTSSKRKRSRAVKRAKPTSNSDWSFEMSSNEGSSTCLKITSTGIESQHQTTR